MRSVTECRIPATPPHTKYLKDTGFARISRVVLAAAELSGTQDTPGRRHACQHGDSGPSTVPKTQHLQRGFYTLLSSSMQRV